MRGGIQPREVGFIDRDTAPGDSWPSALADALETSKVFVALVSPNYLKSDYCGKEWRSFSNRLKAYEQEQGERPKLLIPIKWIPPTNTLPIDVEEIQYATGEEGTEYDIYGLRYLLQNKTPNQSYQEALVKISSLLIDAGHRYRLSPGRIEPLSRITSIFAHEAPADTPYTRPERDFIESYLQRVRSNHERLRFGDPTAQQSVRAGNAQQGRMRLSDVFVIPSVVRNRDRQPTDVTPDLERESVLTALRVPTHQHVVLLGGPGSGKTTLVHYLVYSAATQENGNRLARKAFPVHVRLADVASDGDNSLMTLLTGVHEARRFSSGTELNPTIASFLISRIESGEAALYLDGLDEVRPELLRPLIATITYIADHFQQCKIVVTCREYDYLSHGPSERLPFPELAILPFSLSEMLSYVERWYEAFARVQPLNNAEQLKRQLSDSLHDDEDVREMAATPLLLTLLTIMSITPGRLPSVRSSLYYLTIRQLLAEMPPWRGQDGVSSITVEEILPIAAKVANRLHMRDETPDSHEGFSMRELGKIISEHLGLDQQLGLREYRDIHRKVNAYLIRITQTNGLIVDQGNGVLTFAHRALREFLAGMHFLNGADYEISLACAEKPHWRQPLLLMASHGSREGQSLFYLVKFIADAAAPWKSINFSSALERKLVVAEMLAEIGRQALVSRGYSRVVAKDEAGPPETGLWNRVVLELYRMYTEAELRTDQRVRLLSALGELGDPRFVQFDGTIRLIDPSSMVQLPGGDFELGTNDREVILGSRLPPTPVRQVKVDSFFMAKYPVTNTEYRAFMEEGGYRDLELWDTDEAKLWLVGDPDFVRRLYEESLSSFDRDFQPELTDERRNETELLANLWLMAKARTEPFFWRDIRFNRPNQPVVGVNWWEARAYCNWLTRRLGNQRLVDGDFVFRLPTEHEWERAARPDQHPRSYPWGDEAPDGNKAHSRLGTVKIQRSTPVGAFPQGTWLGGPLDLSGNVWEWTASKAVDPGLEFDLGRDDPSGIKDRVIRGGSWYCLQPLAMRTEYRGVDRLQNVYVDLGFRIVTSMSRKANDLCCLVTPMWSRPVNDARHTSERLP